MAKTFGSQILLPRDPTDPLEAATKQYVDSVVGGGDPTAARGVMSTATAQVVATGTVTRVPLATPTRNDGAFTLTGGNLVCNEAGRYQVIGQIRLTYNQATASQIQVHIRVNETALSPQVITSVPGQVSGHAGAANIVQTSQILDLVVNDRVSLWTFQNTGVDRTVVTDESFVTIERMGAGPAGPTGSTGSTGAGVPTGGTTDQVLAKTSGTDYATAWVSTERVITWPTGTEPSLSGIPDGTMWVEYTP